MRLLLRPSHAGGLAVVAVPGFALEDEATARAVLRRQKARVPRMFMSEEDLPSAGGGGLAGHPNAPGYANSADLDFTQAVPTGGSNGQIGSTGFNTALDAGSLGQNGSNFSRVTDASSPSGGLVWRCGYSAGQTGSDFPSCGGGGYGNFEYHFPTPASKIYWANQIRFADNFTFNATSTKYVTLVVNGGLWAVLIEAMDSGGLWLPVVDNYNERRYTPPTVPALNTVGARDDSHFPQCGPPGRYVSTAGSWHRIEIRIEINTPYCQAWIDGAPQIADPGALPFGGAGGGPSPFNEFWLTHHLGGGPTQVAALTNVGHDNLYLEYE